MFVASQASDSSFSAVASLVLVVAPVTASHIDSYHSGAITDIGGSACDVTWEHLRYTATNQGYGETVEVSSCDNVQVVMYWYREGLGNVTTYGPQQNLVSTLTVNSVLSITWQKACGNANCLQKA